MPRFAVTAEFEVTQSEQRSVIIEAETEEEAIALAESGDGLDWTMDSVTYVSSSEIETHTIEVEQVA